MEWKICLTDSVSAAFIMDDRNMKKSARRKNVLRSFSAEKEGFEPSRRVTDLLVFEARLFSHLSTSPNILYRMCFSSDITFDIFRLLKT